MTGYKSYADFRKRVTAASKIAGFPANAERVSNLWSLNVSDGKGNGITYFIDRAIPMDERGLADLVTELWNDLGKDYLR